MPVRIKADFFSFLVTLFPDLHPEYGFYRRFGLVKIATYGQKIKIKNSNYNHLQLQSKENVASKRQTTFSDFMFEYCIEAERETIWNFANINEIEKKMILLTLNFKIHAKI